LSILDIDKLELKSSKKAEEAQLNTCLEAEWDGKAFIPILWFLHRVLSSGSAVVSNSASVASGFPLVAAAAAATVRLKLLSR
jgi:hypothetical protein